jgi:hypothetical protein
MNTHFKKLHHVYHERIFVQIKKIKIRMKKLITLTAALGLFVCVSVNAQDNSKPAATPQATEAAAIPAATLSQDEHASTKKDEKACKNKSASCCKDKKEANGKSCCKSKDKAEATKVEEAK